MKNPKLLPEKGSIAIIDFGSQYTQLIARRIRDLGVFSTILSWESSFQELCELSPAGIILSGGPSSILEEAAPTFDNRIFELGVPILGICYGYQWIASHFGGKVEKGEQGEYGPTSLSIINPTRLFEGLPSHLTVWNSHGDRVSVLPEDFEVVAFTADEPHAAICNLKKNIYCLQFHPEVTHTEHGEKILANFLFEICHATANWNLGSFIEESIEEIKRKVGKERVILGISGGVDSSVTAALIHKAIGERLYPIFVDTGLLRKNEAQIISELMRRNLGINIHCFDASKEFLTKLRNVADPERKRKIIGNLFIRVFERAAQSVGEAKFLAQGTLYTDIIESAHSGRKGACLIKSHHNVGGLPKRVPFKLIEPLRFLFKDEVRKVGTLLGLSHELLYRHPFPGPGLAVRCLAPIREENLRILRDADAIVIEEIKKAGYYEKVWQAFAVLLPVRSVGVMGDRRTYGFTIALRVVESIDGMTADWAKLPPELLSRLANKIINEVEGVNRVVYDISSKPPATIEWE
ncbi:glutamine-hydrolyzing GMP synthase [Methylacidiphilum sp. Yel]|jgi:GMP synthase (glutamine-hydrolysing)|uniref:glutamine-hydrolyzing GMP synthase n=1 Tax=Methylacidiphilum sp. Yel TaxID=1847730 RepID=UPI001068E8D4|nr:glutamine-hydrolyzing GMP synthase [Methylacidiphilum sp. Yel]TFE66878.1 glutamine-hydrolyzing GMP synthase [Methylacidiphilum sp. Yel]